MADTLQQLMAQRAELDRQIQDAQRARRSDAIAQIQQIMSVNGLTMADISGRAPRAASARSSGTGRKVAPKYRDKAGNTWSGRGLKPKWLQEAINRGANLTDFAI